MRSAWLAALLLAACSFQPAGLGGDDGGGVIDAAPDGDVDAACVASDERCNGEDDDCDGDIDEGFDVGGACDGPDADMCLDDVRQCSADGLATVCTDLPVGVEKCNGLDDDCDMLIDEDWPDLYTPCDGPDSDGCLDDQRVCAPSGATTVCTDVGGDVLEQCDGVDDDCDGTADDEYLIGESCDGGDPDECADGFWVCDSLTAARCDEITPPGRVEDCNGLDDDCDGETDEGYNLDTNLQHCGACYNTCTNAHGGTACVEGVCTPGCVATAQDCNGDPDDGCEVLRDSNPSCGDGTPHLGPIAGDKDSDTATASGAEEAWYILEVHEDSTDDWRISAQITLTSGEGTDFDLYAYCWGCGSSPTRSSTNGPGAVDQVLIVNNDNWGSDNDYDIGIQIVFKSATTCSTWTLDILGNVDGGATCD